MPPVKAYQIPDWANPANASVLDNWWTRTARTIGQFMGVNDPTSQVMGLAAAPIDVPAADAAGAVKQTLKAYHGSPHDFERFDSSKIGTGEGAQAYGHGLYFAEDPGVAGAYRKSLGANADVRVFDGLSQEERAKLPKAVEATMAAIGNGHNIPESFLQSQIVSSVTDPAKRAEVSALVDKARAYGFKNQFGRTYEVNIHASPDELLDWDKPLNQQPRKVQEALTKAGVPLEVPDNSAEVTYRFINGEMVPVNQPMRSPLASEAYEFGFGKTPKYMGVSQTKEAVSQKLHQMGIKGIQYLDQGSRAAYSQATQGMVDSFGSPEKALVGLKARLASNTDPERAGILRGMINELAKPQTRNFVIFPGNEHLIDIARKYGVSLAAAKAIYEARQRTTPQPAQ